MTIRRGIRHQDSQPFQKWFIFCKSHYPPLVRMQYQRVWNVLLVDHHSVTLHQVMLAHGLAYVCFHTLISFEWLLLLLLDYKWYQHEFMEGSEVAHPEL